MAEKILRPHQVLAIDMIKDALRSGKRRPVLQAPCGFGKTVVAAAIVKGALAKGNRVAFLAPAISLINQTAVRFSEDGIAVNDIGVMQANHEWTQPECPVQICSVDTLARRDLPKSDLVIVDECHRQSDVIKKWMMDPDSGVKMWVGLSATPWAKEMGKYYDCLLKPASLQGLIDSGDLAPFIAYGPATPDLSAVKMVAGDYHEGQLAELMDTGALVGDIVTTWLEKGEGRPTLMFGVNRAHARHVCDEFNENGIPAAYIDAFTPVDERETLGEKLQNGELKVICNIGTLTTGIDWPKVSCIILARPTKSRMLAVQILGRGLRNAPGKKDCLILDHSGTLRHMGLPTEIDFEKLSVGAEKNDTKKPTEKEERMLLPKPCVACGCLVAPMMKCCPACGHVDKRASEVAVIDGELTQITKGSRHKGISSERLLSDLLLQRKQDVWSQIKKMQRDRQWSDGRAAHVYKDIFWVWPRGLDDRPADFCSPELVSFVRRRNRAYAKIMKG